MQAENHSNMATQIWLDDLKLLYKLYTIYCSFGVPYSN